MIENHMPLKALRKLRILALLDLRADVHIIEDALTGGGALADHIQNIHKLAHGVGNHPEIAENGYHIAGRKGTALGQHAAHQ